MMNTLESATSSKILTPETKERERESQAERRYRFPPFKLNSRNNYFICQKNQKKNLIQMKQVLKFYLSFHGFY